MACYNGPLPTPLIPTASLTDRLGRRELVVAIPAYPPAVGLPGMISSRSQSRVRARRLIRLRRLDFRFPWAVCMGAAALWGAAVVPALPAQEVEVVEEVVAGEATASPLDASPTDVESPAVESGLTVADGEEGYVRFTFQDAPWPEVLRQFADWADLTLDMTDVPPGEFSYYDNRRHDPSDVIDILNGYLLPRGYALIRRDRFLVVLKTDNEILSTLVPTIPLAELTDRGSNELLRVVVPIDELAPSAAAEEVRGLLGPLGKATPLDSSQSLVLQGFGSNLRQAVELLQAAVPPVTDDSLDFRSFPLRHLSAVEAESQVRNLFGLSTGTLNVSGARSSMERALAYRRGGQRRGDDDRREQPAPPIPLLEQVAMNMKVSAISRTNSLLVTATPAGLALVEEVVKTIDVPQDAESLETRRDSTRFLRVYTVYEADEEEVAKTLDVIIPGVVVNEDRRNEAIHVLATAREHAEVEALIRTLDGGDPREQSTVEVIPVRRFDVYAMSELLLRLFENDDPDDRPVIQPEPQTRTLVIRGTDEQVAQIRTALKAYGEGDGDAAMGAAARIRSVPVPGSKAESVIRAAREVIGDDSSDGRGIRIVVPGRNDRDPKSIAPDREAERRSRITPVDDEPRRATPDTNHSVLERPAATPSSQPHFQNARFTRVAAIDASQVLSESGRAAEEGGAATEGGAAQPAADSDGADAADGESSETSSERVPRVNVEVRGDQILLYSSDIEALDEVEATIRQLAGQMPDRTEWTVFYLRAAEAEPTASRLYELLPPPLPMLYDRPLGLTSAAAAPASELQIVPDPRTNALFVSGSAAEVAQVEELLELLDSVELPESFRSRVPRPIPVRYADVSEIAEVIRELYKDYLTDPAAEQRREERRGGDRGRDDRDDNQRRGGAAGQASPGIRLTLAVDERTSELLVSCDEMLFRELSELVEQRDLAARDTQPTVSVIRVGSTVPDELGTILESMLPKITATVTEPPEENDSDRRSDRRRRDRGDRRGRD